MTVFLVVKFIHVLLAIVAVGFNATYGVWLGTVARQPTPVQAFVLRGVKRLDDWFANPAYLLLAVSGVTMVFLGGLSFTTFWIAGGIVLWVIAIILGLALQSTLSDVFSGIVLNFSRPYRPGDWISIDGGTDGRVVSPGSRRRLRLRQEADDRAR